MSCELMTSPDLDWVPGAGAPAKSSMRAVDTEDATETTLWFAELAREALSDISVTVLGRSSTDEHFAIDLRAAWSRTASEDPVERRAPTQSNALATNPAGWNAVLDLSGTTPRVRVTGAADKSIRWSALVSIQAVVIKATPFVFDPAVMELTGWWPPSFTASPLLGADSAGTSGSHDLAEATNPPSVGAALNGLTPAAYNGTNDRLVGPAISNLVDSAFSFVTLIKANVLVPYFQSSNNPAIFTDTGGYLLLNVTDDGAQLQVYDGAERLSPFAAMNEGEWTLIRGKWNGTHLYLAKGRDAFGAGVASGAPQIQTGLFRMGANFNGTAFYNGEVFDTLCSGEDWSDEDFENVTLYLEALSGLTFS